MDSDRDVSRSLDFNLKWWPQSPCVGRYAFAFICLFFILIIIYANSLNGTFVFDDKSRIANNPNIRMERFDFESLTNSLRDEDTGDMRLWRPLAFVTFALNYYTGGLNVTGFHIFNIGVHFLAACFLFLFIHSMLNLPLLNGKYESLSYPLALITTFFWAVHPIQVTSVTYIVQRMASMAGMFYIAAMYFYLKGRFASGKSKFAWFAATVLSGLCALASKENSILLVPSLALLELILIQGATRENIIRFGRWIFWIGALCALAAFLVTNPFTVLEDYVFRPFTVWERLITQPRVIMLYLSLLIYPTSSKMTFLYDVPHSTSLVHPISTLWCLILILGALAAGLGLTKKRPVISFCILFFLLNHAVESTILPIEMVYEHRNYIPSMMFFLPVFLIYLRALGRITDKSSVHFLGVALIGCSLISNGHTVMLRNGKFATEGSFWLDNINKSPSLSVPWWNYGNFLWNSGDQKGAAKCFQEASRLNRYENLLQQGQLLYNLGLTYLENENLPNVAIGYFKAAYNLNGVRAMACQQIAISYIHLNELDKALDWCSRGLKLSPKNGELLFTKANVLFKMGNYDAALQVAAASKRILPSYGSSTILMAQVVKNRGNFTLAKNLLKLAIYEKPNNAEPILALIEVASQDKDEALVRKSVLKLYGLKGNLSLNEVLTEFKTQEPVLVYSPDIEILVPAIEKVLSGEITNTLGS